MAKAVPVQVRPWAPLNTKSLFSNTKRQVLFSLLVFDFRSYKSHYFSGFFLPALSAAGVYFYFFSLFKYARTHFSFCILSICIYFKNNGKKVIV